MHLHTHTYTNTVIQEQKQDLMGPLGKNLSQGGVDDLKKGAFETFYVVSADKCGLVIGKGERGWEDDGGVRRWVR